MDQRGGRRSVVWSRTDSPRVNASELGFERGEGSLAVACVHFAPFEAAGSLTGLFQPRDFDLVGRLDRQRVEEGLRDPSALVIRERQGVIEHLLRGGGHVLSLRTAGATFHPNVFTGAWSGGLRPNVLGPRVGDEFKFAANDPLPHATLARACDAVPAKCDEPQLGWGQ